MTRRVVKPQPELFYTLGETRDPINPEQIAFKVMEKGGKDVLVIPPWQPGDRLWVRETWADLRGMGFGNDPNTDKPWNYAYKADIKPGSDSDRARIDYGVKWKSSRFMPKAAARIWLEVVNVRVERLHDITNDDAIAEGIKPCPRRMIDDCDCAIAEFSSLWDSLNAKRGYGWDVNPWVWVVEFRRVEK